MVALFFSGWVVLLPVLMFRRARRATERSAAGE
jgi:hypothetical protein